ncbi:MAG: SAM hydrolase/SAM-dependent halogenase family protein [Candidatus Thorarchaeota archaeon]|jgi:S-adenosylmethionine hydrolase
MTDFGDSEYVGVMKGVIYSISPKAEIVDLTHGIPPQSVREGAWVLLKSYTHFPKGSVFVCVVDPGVGSERDAVLVRTKNYTFIGPDNGLLYEAVCDDEMENVSSIMIESSASNTFHGRDVFAVAAAYYLRNQVNKVLGGFKSSLSVKLEFHQEGRTGEIVRIDRFGNIITNIPPQEKTEFKLLTNDLRWDIGWFPTYSEGPDRGIFLVTGSYNTLEIAARNTSASDEVHLSVGERVTIE